MTELFTRIRGAWRVLTGTHKAVASIRYIGVVDGKLVRTPPVFTNGTIKIGSGRVNVTGQMNPTRDEQ